MFEIKTKVSKERVRDLLITGFEQGVGYWCVICDHTPDTVSNICDAPFAGGSVTCQVNDEEDPEDLCLDLAAIRRGLDLMANDYPFHMGNFMNEQEDAETGDVFIQLCLLGEIVYG